MPGQVTLPVPIDWTWSFTNWWLESMATVTRKGTSIQLRGLFDVEQPATLIVEERPEPEPEKPRTPPLAPEGATTVVGPQRGRAPPTH